MTIVCGRNLSISIRDMSDKLKALAAKLRNHEGNPNGVYGEQTEEERKEFNALQKEHDDLLKRIALAKI